MFAKSIIDSDAFLDMSLTTQALYFHLNMRADDDGFVNNPRKIQRMINASDDDMRILIAKNFIIPFESGIVVIKHWKIHNYIQSDRYKETNYQEEKSLLMLKENKSYTLNANQCIQNGYNMDTQVRLGKDSIDKVSVDKDSINNNILSGKKSDNDKKNSFSEKISKIINYLNDVLETRYTTKSKSTNSLIKARLEEGHTVDDFKAVIDNKKREWGNDPKMVKYLRPETLFKASHFESYLNESKPKEIDHSKDYYQKPEYVPPTEEEELRAKKWREYLESDEDV